MRNKINITLGEEGLINLPEQLLENDYSGLFVLVDINTKTHCLPSFISQTGLDQVKILVMEAGEENKNLQTCKKSMGYTCFFCFVIVIYLFVV